MRIPGTTDRHPTFSSLQNAKKNKKMKRKEERRKKSRANRYRKDYLLGNWQTPKENGESQLKVCWYNMLKNAA